MIILLLNKVNWSTVSCQSIVNAIIISPGINSGLWRRVHILCKKVWLLTTA